jgi:hypothetical protein
MSWARERGKRLFDDAVYFPMQKLTSGGKLWWFKGFSENR